ncbi:MAG: hypothetical protein OEL75_01550 [Kiritimatiellaceae bacterium]|nr:hypothetical protein [Kiritimatiellaceae bacterium]
MSAAAGFVQRLVKMLKAEFPDLTLFTDVCMCGYSHYLLG